MRTGFRLVLEETGDIEVVGEAADGSQALDVVARSRPDVVLMDVRMPAWTASRPPAASASAPTRPA